MVLSRQLQAAFVLSLLWHLFCISFVGIELSPGVVETRKSYALHFLGSILGDNIFPQWGSDANEQALLEVPDVVNLQKKEVISKEFFHSLLTNKQTFDIEKLIAIDRPEQSLASFAWVAPKDAIVKREVIFKPEFPRYPEWMQHEFKGSKVVFKIYISAEGLVEQLINVHSSANPEIDAALARYLSRWRFAPVGSGEQKGNWQTITLDLDVKL